MQAVSYPENHNKVATDASQMYFQPRIIRKTE